MVRSLANRLFASSPNVIFVALIAATFTLTSCSSPEREFPASIEVDQILASTSSGFFMEACVASVFRLSKATANAASEQGLSFFEGMASPPNQNPSNPYSKWVETPTSDDVRQKYIYATGAIGGCGESGEYHSAELRNALAQKGSFYALTQNREGMIVVAPRSKLAAFFYFG